MLNRIPAFIAQFRQTGRTAQRQPTGKPPESERNSAEFALQESKKRYQELAEAIPQMVLMADETGSITYWNQRWYDYSGLSEADSLGLAGIETVHPHDRDHTLNQWSTAISSGEAFEVEHRIRRHDGMYRWFINRIVPFRDASGKIANWIGTVTDIHDQKQVQEELRQSEERLSLALRSAQAGMWQWFVDNNKTIWSDENYRLLGYEPGRDRPTYENWMQAIHPDDRQKVEQAIEKTFRERSSFYRCEYRVCLPDGSERWFADRGQLTYRDDGEPDGMIGIQIDITQRKQAESALYKSEERLRLALEAARMGNWDWDILTNQIIWSESLERMMGLQPGTFDGRFETVRNMIHPDDQSRVLTAITRSVEQGDDYEIEFRFTKPDGSIRWAGSKGDVFRDSAGRAIRMAGVDVDITDRKLAEQALQRAKETAEAANLAKSVFLANMSHELRTPLNVILGYAQLLSYDVTLMPEHQEYLRSIHRSGNHLLSLINEVLDLSKIEAGCLSLNESQFSLPELIRTLCEMFHLRAETKGLSLLLDLPENLPQVITADLNKLRQVLINLLGNAVKFTESGNITLRAYLLAQEQKESAAKLHIEVIDTGVGIAPDELDTIFETFYQGNAGRISTEGTGLGLAISQRFVELMGGELQVDSVVGQGSQFKLWIPVQVADTIETTPNFPDRPIVGLRPDQPKYRVLVVDDQPANRQLLVHFLHKVGLDVQEAASGAEAIQQWETWNPHLIWMDIRMRSMTGIEAVQQIRSQEKIQVKQNLDESNGKDAVPPPGSDAAVPLPQPPIPIIAITAQAYQQDRDRALAAGFTDFISKPFEVNQVFHRLALHLGLQYQYADAPQADSVPPSENHAENQPQSLQPQALQVMPAEWIAALYTASLNCSSSEVQGLIDQIPPQCSALSQHLKHLVYNYDFEAIMNLSQTD